MKVLLLVLISGFSSLLADLFVDIGDWADRKLYILGRKNESN